MTTPEPVVVEVCSVCRLPWDDHTAAARARISADLDPHSEGYWVALALIEDKGPRIVRLTDCVVLLMRANQGPPGPQGPMGPTGLSASSSRRA